MSTRFCDRCQAPLPPHLVDAGTGRCPICQFPYTPGPFDRGPVLVPPSTDPVELQRRADAALLHRDITRQALIVAEVEALFAVLDVVHGNQIAAAPLLGISVATLKRHLIEAGYDAEKARARWPVEGRYRSEIP